MMKLIAFFRKTNFSAKVSSGDADSCFDKTINRVAKKLEKFFFLKIRQRWIFIIIPIENFCLKCSPVYIEKIKS